MNSQSEGVNGWSSVGVGVEVHRQVQMEKENEHVWLGMDDGKTDE